jgi:hypothetical protein
VVYESLSTLASRVAVAANQTIEIHDGTNFALLGQIEVQDRGVTQLGVFYTNNAPRLAAVHGDAISVYDADSLEVLHVIKTRVPGTLTVYNEQERGRARLVVAMAGNLGGLLIADAETGEQVRPSLMLLASDRAVPGMA